MTAATAEQAVHWVRQNVPASAQLTSDSRRVAPGDVFLAYPGRKADGRRFIAAAAAQGAAAALYDAEGWPAASDWPIPALGTEALKRHAGTIAALWYGEPSRALWSIGITGTSGKSSCALWIAEALLSLGRHPLVVGTLGVGFFGALSEHGLTTPDPVELQRSLHAFVAQGADTLAMEVSSIGLEEKRVEGMHFDIALFTNLSRDHLDYHGTMERYEAAKSQLVTWPGLKHLVVNIDDRAGVRMALLAEKCGVAVTRFSAADAPGAQLRATAVRPATDGMDLELAIGAGRRSLHTPFIGTHNASNLLGVLGVLIASGVELDAALAALARLHPAPGRLERVAGGAGPLVLVDYAHKPDALEKVLEACVPLASAREGDLVVVFGCGGDRDAGKRPLMGAIAARLANRVVITSDNPRSENPEVIVEAIAAGIGKSRSHVTQTVDRRQAIAQAIAAARSNDVIVIAGKGHESYQEIAGVKHPFSDLEEASRALALRDASPS